MNGPETKVNRERWGSGFAGSLLALVLVCCSASHAEPWRFIIAGDSRGSDNGVNTAILGELADEWAGSQAEFILFPGDLVSGDVNQTQLESQFWTWKNTMQPVYDAGIAVYPIRGNHDVGSPAGVTAWNNVFPELPDNGPAGETNLTYSITRRNVFVLGLDEYIRSHRVNQAWVDSQLATNTKPHVFAFGHEPAFAAKHQSCLDNYPTNRTTFWQSLEAAGARVYGAGHDHFYDHACIEDNDGNPDNNLHQLIVGTAGAPIYHWSPPYVGDNGSYTPEQLYHAEQYGYVLVEVNDLNVTLTWMERTSPGVFVPTEVWGYAVEWPCPPDINGDGQTNYLDFIMFLTYFADGDPKVDYNADGTVNSKDFTAFLNDFAAGC